MEDTKLPAENTPKVETTTEVKPKKKVSGCLIVFLVFLGLLLLLIGGAYFGYRKISKDLKTQVDLGVKYTSEDVVDFGSLVEITPENYFEVKDGIDVSLTSTQVTAMLNSNLGDARLSNSQIKFNRDNLQVSTLVQLEIQQGKTFNLPLYISANVTEITSTKQNLDIQEIKIGLLKLPNLLQEKVNSLVEEWLKGVIVENLSSFDFDSIFLTDDRVDIHGLLLDKLR